ncbi:MAG: response regulator [Planctomycetes bacterium]|nr:response regulator [Planctomycetota bacterium]
MAPILNPTRVLCVDDNQDTADSEAALLQLAGYETVACYSGQSAIIEAANFLPDICLIDMNMPGMDGDELAVRLRNPDRPIVMMAVTAMNDAEGCQRIKAAGFDRHLLKPVAPQDLLAAVRELLAT